MGRCFFLGADVGIIVDGIDVMAESEDFLTKKNSGLWKNKREPKKKKNSYRGRQMKERPPEKRPTKNKVDEL